MYQQHLQKQHRAGWTRLNVGGEKHRLIILQLRLFVYKQSKHK